MADDRSLYCNARPARRKKRQESCQQCHMFPEEYISPVICWKHHGCILSPSAQVYCLLQHLQILQVLILSGKAKSLWRCTRCGRRLRSW